MIVSPLFYGIYPFGKLLFALGLPERGMIDGHL